MDSYNVKVGKRIGQARLNAKMTKRELADKIGLHESTVKRYEDGEIKQLDIEKVAQFAKVLGVRQEYLMCWDDKIEMNNSETIEKKMKLDNNQKMRILKYAELLSKLDEKQQGLVLGMIDQLSKNE